MADLDAIETDVTGVSPSQGLLMGLEDASQAQGSTANQQPWW
jgi:hypothetical protein